MIFKKASIKDVRLIEPEVYLDHRGSFRRLFCEKEFAEDDINFKLRQCNLSQNPQKWTFRGFHFQHPPYEEGKVLQCIRGSIYDILVDLRTYSETYLKWEAFELNEENRLSLYVPPGCANAWLTTCKDTWIYYNHSEFYTPQGEGGIRYNDPTFSFKWPHEPECISDKDLSYPDFKQIVAPLKQIELLSP